MIGQFVKQSWLVIVAALVFGMLVAGVNGALEDRINANSQQKMESARKILMPAAMAFDEVKTTGTDGKSFSYHVGKDQAGRIIGYTFTAEGGGFADKIGLLIAVDAELGTLLGIAILKTNETPGFGDKMKDDEFKGQFANCPVSQKLTVAKTGNRTKVDSEIVAITGATITSEAVTAIVNNAVARMRAVLQK